MGAILGGFFLLVTCPVFSRALHLPRSTHLDALSVPSGPGAAGPLRALCVDPVGGTG